MAALWQSPEFWLPLIILLLTGAGWLLKRHIARTNAHERVGLYGNLAALLTSLRDSEISLDNLEQLEKYFDGRAQTLPEVEAPLKALLGARVDVEMREKLPPEPPGYWSQIEMNARAFAAYNVADAKLELAVAELKSLIGASSWDLDKVQRAWKLYRDREAQFAASFFSGGNIQPLIRWSEAHALSEQREAELREEAAFRRAGGEGIRDRHARSAE